MRLKILSLEDEPTIQEVIRQSLRDYDVTVVSTVKQAELAIEKQKFDAILVDIELPDGDGLHFYTRAVQDPNFKDIPCLFITGKTEISLKLMAFTVGADDFLTKPFDPSELNARVTSKIRKHQLNQIQKNSKRVADVEIDLDRQKAIQIQETQERDLGLTAHEFKILSLLSRGLERVYSREQILSEVWGNTSITDRTVDSHIAHLRQKISTTAISIETVKGLGYRLIKKPES